MKKIYTLILALLFTTACQQENFKGNEYLLTDNTTDTPVTIGFDKNENRFFGKAVNNYFGSYQLEGSKISFSQVGSTMMMGSPEGMALEQSYFKELSDVDSYQEKGNTLTLILKNGKRLSFEKTGPVKTK